MAYRISYATEMNSNTTGKIHMVRTLGLSVLCCCLFLSIVYRCCPEGAAILDKLKSYDGWTHIKGSLEVLALELHYGTRLSEAVTVFFREVANGSLFLGA